MKIPRTTEHVEIELKPGPRDFQRAPFSGNVALLATVRVNGHTLQCAEEMRAEYLDQEGYGDAVFERLARQIGRKVLFG